MKKQMLKARLTFLMDQHDMSKCRVEEGCEKCNEIELVVDSLGWRKELDKFVLVNRDSRVKTFNSILEIQKFLKCSELKVSIAIETGKEIKAWTIDRTIEGKVYVE